MPLESPSPEAVITYEADEWILNLSFVNKCKILKYELKNF